jgi:predicted nuclease with TOPRIM domain
MTEFQIRTIIDSLEVKLRKLVMAYTELKDQLKESQKEKELLKKKIIEMERDQFGITEKIKRTV